MLGGKRSLALRESALGHEALRRFVAREPLRRVHECVFAVLALESEPIDPRLKMGGSELPLSAAVPSSASGASQSLPPSS